MIVEIQGVDFINKGGELMTHAIVQHVASLPGNNIVAAHLRMGNFQQRAKTGLHHLSWVYYEKAPWVGSVIDGFSRFIPKPLLNSLKITTNSQIYAVLDASGFTYGDQQGARMIEIMANRTKRWKKEGKKLILLPQAFGPFQKKAVKEAFLEILKNADFVFARDPVSYHYLMELECSQSKIKIAPDFTNLVKGEIPPYFQSNSRQGCIVPNYRMIQRTSSAEKENYLSFLTFCTKYLIKKGIEPFALIHETNRDYELALQLQSEVGVAIKIIQEPNPLYIKGILGNCFIVIGSRFHSLVSTLSQGVPCMGTGWSHKYQMLFEDYNCSDSLVSPIDSPDKISNLLDKLIEEPSRSELIAGINAGATEQKKRSTQMWRDVDHFLGF
ncbi:MAG: polysaccharide pyruvyl transferase family protein [Coleofasciculus sp. G3-WIS-01]|uniref:polysaccharide pyruvyl transferase family protein n=1 Tax=Coleofasciculus sp. G3-WIS-01 TaxID=3069528 RepID=UPI00330408EE